MFDSTLMPGALVPISGTDPSRGIWEHRAFVADPLPSEDPPLTGSTYRQVARAHGSLARLDATARQLRNPSLLRQPVLRREAQSTSALEGTYAPLADVLSEDEQAPTTTNLREIFNYLFMAEQAFAWASEGRPLTASLLADLQGVLVRGTPSERNWPGQIRGDQVVIGRRLDADADEFPATAARFVPAPPGHDLSARVRDLVDWISATPRRAAGLDPLVAAGMAHYQFETLHPFHDGNGRVGRLLIVLHLLIAGVVIEPTLSVSPWFEARRSDYYDHLHAVSCVGAWDAWIRFFATGLEASAADTHRRVDGLLDVRNRLLQQIADSPLRSATAQKMVDIAVSRSSFTAKQAATNLGVTYPRANKLISQLVELDILAPVSQTATYDRRFHAPAVTEVLLAV